MKKYYNIEIDCAACAMKCEQAIKKVEGVISCSVNFITQRMMIEADDKSYADVLDKAVKSAKKIESDFEIEM